ncbi:MAG: hypothetical protein PVG14_19445 [Anaerolineales bacterium]
MIAEKTNPEAHPRHRFNPRAPVLVLRTPQAEHEPDKRDQQL